MRPFAEATASVVRPLAAAMPESVSPGVTRWPPDGAPAGVVPDPAAGAGALPAAGIRSVVPAMANDVGLRPLAEASACVVRPLAAAMPESVSPGVTRCPPAAGAVPGLAACGAGAAAACGAVVPAAGIVRFAPAIANAVGLRPLAAASASVVRPFAAAMPERVSPGSTVCAAAELGSMRPRAQSAPASRRG